MEEYKQRKTIFLLFFASGVSGLIYEVVWMRILSRIVGVTTYATATVLAAFMAGLALGAFLFGILADRRKNPLGLYAALQLGIACAALFMPLILTGLIPFYKYLFHITHQNRAALLGARLGISFLLFLIPTTLMGGTLPVLTSFLARREKVFGRNLSLLYGINTFGAVFGVLLSGFVTIGSLGERSTVFIGVMINLIVGVAALRLSRDTASSPVPLRTDGKEPERRDIRISPYPDRVRRTILVAVLISGFTALAYEVIWSRQLVLFLETSIYAFSAMLATYLLGIAAGSLAVNKIIDRLTAPLAVFGILELCVGILSIGSLYLFFPLDAMPAGAFLAPLVLVFPPAFLFGAIFPVCSRCYAHSIKTSGTSVGILYGFNTIGNVAGAALAGFLLIGIIGSSRSIASLALLNVTVGTILIAMEPKRPPAYKAAFLAAIPLVVILGIGFGEGSAFLGVIERRIARGPEAYEIFHNRETVEGTVTCYAEGGHKWLWINGMGQTFLCTETKLMAHLPVLLASDPRDILIICFGMGTTLKSACVHEGLSITAVDLVPELFKCFGYYHTKAEGILERENVKVVGEDGRTFLLYSGDTYDVITVDPSPPIHSAGTVNLYTREFFTLCREHLAPGGVACLWFPYGADDLEISEEDLAYILSTFRSVFPHMTVWRGPHGWGYYLIGTLRKQEIDRERLKAAFAERDIVDDLGEFDTSCVSYDQLIQLLVIDERNIGNVTSDAMIITDDYPYTEFPLWRNVRASFRRYLHRMAQRRSNR